MPATRGAQPGGTAATATRVARAHRLRAPADDAEIDVVRSVDDAVRALRGVRCLLAVSGGLDSSVLLHVASRVLDSRDVVVASFDHGTGDAARHAVEHVATMAARAGLRMVLGRSSAPGRTEAEFRADRWRFLREVAHTATASIVTAHTRDDQAETVFLRVLRGAGARGLAGLLAPSDIRRPLVRVSRAVLEAYARANNITYVTDPSNSTRAHLRNRVRLDLLPALESARPGFTCELLAIGERAAEWRSRIEEIALTFPMMTTSTETVFAREPLRELPDASLRTLWPALAARTGVVLDRRGTVRLAAFTIESATGARIQLAGHVDVSMRRDAIAFSRSSRRVHTTSRRRRDG